MNNKRNGLVFLLVRITYIAAAFIVFCYGTAEATDVSAGKDKPKFSDSRIVAGTAIYHSLSNVLPDIQLGKGGSKIGTEIPMSVNKPVVVVSPSSQPMIGNVSKQKYNSANECGDYCGLYGLLPVLFGIMAWPILFFQSNVFKMVRA